jgi:putative membrane protein
MKQIRNIFIAVLFISFVSSCDNARKDDSNAIAEEKNHKNFDTKAEEKEADFVSDAIEDKYAEIKLAELASTKSSNRQVQEVAQAMVNDQTTSLTALQNLANKKGISIPVEEGEEAKEKVNTLSKQEDPDFDKKWCDEIVSNHEKAIRAYEVMRDRSSDTELKEIITNDLIVLRAQLDKLNALEKSIM